MKKEQIAEEYTLFKRYVQHLQATQLQDEGMPRRDIKVTFNREMAYEIDIKVKKNRDNLPLRTNHYKSIPQNIRLQHPTPVLLERLTPLSMSTPRAEEIEEHIQIIEQCLSKSIDDSKNYLQNTQKVFVDYFLLKYKFQSVKEVFQLQELAKYLGVSLDLMQQYFLARLAPQYNSINYQVKYQFVRFNRYFCPICNMYLCSVHYHSKNQRLYIEREPEEEPQDQQKNDPTHYDNFYETEFKPNQQVLKEMIGKYKLSNKLESEQRCKDTQTCGKFGGDSARMKKFQQKAIEQMLEFGFTNCCFMFKILQHRMHSLTCAQISYVIKTWRSHIPVQDKQKKQYKTKQNFQSSNYLQQYIPCFHEGNCGTTNCSCVQCFKYCCCKGKCEQGVKSCECKNCGYDEKKQKFACPCYTAGQECDPTVCKCSSCNNKNLLLQTRKKLVLGKSLICNGLGLFAAQRFRQYEYIGEYTGNYLLLDEESSIVEQCDWITNNHYLFEIDDKWQVDGTYYSNVLRYINHASKKSEIANCQASVLFSEGRWRIAMIATKEILIGEELFFDYGDKFKTKWLSSFNQLSDQYFKK